MMQVTLINPFDEHLVERGLRGAVRRVVIDAIPDRGVVCLAIPEEVADALGVNISYRPNHHRVRMPDGRWITPPIAEYLRIEVGDLRMGCDALVLPRGSQPRLGMIQLDAMDPENWVLYKVA